VGEVRILHVCPLVCAPSTTSLEQHALMASQLECRPTIRADARWYFTVSLTIHIGWHLRRSSICAAHEILKRHVQGYLIRCTLDSKSVQLSCHAAKLYLSAMSEVARYREASVGQKNARLLHSSLRRGLRSLTGGL
jgi:hypothetical protein